jgi:DNA-binding response OmpR family regulator
VHEVHTIRVLVVDEEPALRRLIRLVLQGGGFDVVEASTSDEAYMLLRRPATRPDVLLMEQVLSPATGTALIRRIRRNARLANVPIIIMTGRVGEKDRADALAAGADAFIAKPFSPVMLRDCVLQFALRGRAGATDGSGTMKRRSASNQSG